MRCVTWAFDGGAAVSIPGTDLTPLGGGGRSRGAANQAMVSAAGIGKRAAALVLVADRDPVVRELEAHFLGEAGFAVEFADDGPSALERALQIQPDIVVTEVLLPQLDGLTLCRRLKAEPATRDVPVVVFSVLSAGERAREAGAAAFLSKPLAEQVLVETIRAVLAKRKDGMEVVELRREASA